MDGNIYCEFVFSEIYKDIKNYSIATLIVIQNNYNNLNIIILFNHHE